MFAKISAIFLVKGVIFYYGLVPSGTSPIKLLISRKDFIHLIKFLNSQINLLTQNPLDMEK